MKGVTKISTESRLVTTLELWPRLGTCMNIQRSCWSCWPVLPRVTLSVTDSHEKWWSNLVQFKWILLMYRATVKSQHNAYGPGRNKHPSRGLLWVLRLQGWEMATTQSDLSYARCSTITGLPLQESPLKKRRERVGVVLGLYHTWHVYDGVDETWWDACGQLSLLIPHVHVQSNSCWSFTLYVHSCSCGITKHNRVLRLCPHHQTVKSLLD